MGMDAYRFKFVRAFYPQEGKDLYNEDFTGKYRRIEVNARTLDWMKANDIRSDYISKEKELDWPTWFEKNPQYKGCEFGNYEFTEDGKGNWVQIYYDQGKTEIITEGFCYKDVEYIYVEVKNVGYMRKPFRHSEIPSKVDGDTLVLSVTNFSDEGEVALQELKKIDAQQSEECNVLIYDVDQLGKLKDCSNDFQHFDKAFMKDWKPNHFVLFNW